MKVEKRINEIVNRLNKTKVERKPDLKGAHMCRYCGFPICPTLLVYALPASAFLASYRLYPILTRVLCSAEREAVNAAETAERKHLLRDKVSHFILVT